MIWGERCNGVGFPPTDRTGIILSSMLNSTLVAQVILRWLCKTAPAHARHPLPPSLRGCEGRVVDGGSINELPRHGEPVHVHPVV